MADSALDINRCHRYPFAVCFKHPCSELGVAHDHSYPGCLVDSKDAELPDWYRQGHTMPHHATRDAGCNQAEAGQGLGGWNGGCAGNT